MTNGIKTISASIWITTHGRFPRKMQDMSTTLDNIIDTMRVYAPKIPINEARTMIQRGAFSMETVWSSDRTIGIKVDSVIADRITTEDLTDALFLLDEFEPGPALIPGRFLQPVSA